MEAQSYSLTLEDRVSVEYITKHIASVQQVVMQCGHFLLWRCLVAACVWPQQQLYNPLFLLAALHPERRGASVRDFDADLWI
jgi:hypothetical protein